MGPDRVDTCPEQRRQRTDGEQYYCELLYVHDDGR